MLPNNRTASANGLTIFPRISIGAIASDMMTAPGPLSPGGLGKIVRRYPLGPSFLKPLISIVRKAVIASAPVTARFPVGVAPWGKRPSRLQ